MERKTSQKILLWNYCYVSYIWFQEMIFDVFRDLKDRLVRGPLGPIRPEVSCFRWSWSRPSHVGSKLKDSQNRTTFFTELLRRPI